MAIKGGIFMKKGETKNREMIWRKVKNRVTLAVVTALMIAVYPACTIHISMQICDFTK